MATRRRLSNTLGIELAGVDLRRLDEPAFREIEQAFWDGQVLVVRDQELRAAEFVAFACRFGRPEPHVIDQFHHHEARDVLILSNRRAADGAPLGLQDAGSYFHTDYSYLEVAARLTMLYSIEAPSRGGETLFADMYAAYEDLPAALRRRIDGLTVLHHYGNRDDLDEASRTAASRLTDEQRAKMRFVRHPLVRVHHGTGRKALYAVSGSSFGILGMPDDEAIALLDELKDHALQERYRWAHRYRVGDVVLWDDVATLHSATLTDPDDPRTLWRVTVKEPFGAWA
jgi:taurine dioxygenase